MPTDGHGLPTLDPDAGLHRRTWDDGENIMVEVVTAAEALDQNAELADRGHAVGATYFADSPDEVLVSEDGRPMAVHYSAAAKQQLDQYPEAA